jgi:transposase
MAERRCGISSKRYTDEFKIEAVKQVTDRGQVDDVAARIGVTTYSLYAWVRKFGKPASAASAEVESNAEVRRLRLAFSSGDVEYESGTTSST